MKELKFEELTLKQKLGMVCTPLINGGTKEERDDDFIIEKVKNRELGSVWIQIGYSDAEEMMRRVKEVADYPILIFTDAEGGMGEYKVGRRNAVGATGSEAHAYAWGKATAVTARKNGYNVVCNPVIDLSNAGNQRSLGSDLDKVVPIAKAIARGMHDGGVLTVGKHYVAGNNPKKVDSHMGEPISTTTKEELLEYQLIPYMELNKAGLLDGIMAGHKKFVNIDPQHPTSLSPKMMGIIREQGFDGFSITDGMCMMGIRANYDDVTAKGLAINAGNMLLPFTVKNKQVFAELEEAYEKGLIDNDRLDEAVKRVLAAQKKAMELPKDNELTEEEKTLVMNIPKDGIYIRKDEGLSDSIPKDGNYLFVILSSMELDVDGEGKPIVDTFSRGWHFPDKMSAKIKELFPNATVKVINQFPTPGQNNKVLAESIGKEVIIVTFHQEQAYVGPPHLTRRFIALVDALQLTNRVSTAIHFGNPFVLKELPHIPRYILGGVTEVSTYTCFEVLAGEYPAKGVPTYNVDLK